MKNPFRFGQEVSGYQFYDRKKITRELRQKMVDGSSNVVLFAPRRYGKTSLVVRVLEELSVKDGIKGLCFDMTRVTNLGRFCEAYVNAVYAMTGGRKELMHKLADYLASFRPELTVTVAGAVRIRLDVAAALIALSRLGRRWILARFGMALIVTHHYVVNSTIMDQFATGIVKPFFDRFLNV